MPELSNNDPVGRVPSRGDPGGVPSRGESDSVAKAPQSAKLPVNKPPPCRLRRLHRVWPDRDGNISYLLTICVEGRAQVLDNEECFQRLASFLLDSPQRCNWFGRRFVVMPDHIHLIAHQGNDAVRLGQWIKALKAVVGGLKRREDISVGPPHAGSGDPAYNATQPVDVGRLPPAGVREGNISTEDTREFTRIPRVWRWQESFHDHKFHTPESESRKWEYVCLNPVRYRLVRCPEEWPFGGEIFYDEADGPRLVTGTPPLLEGGMLIEEKTQCGDKPKTPGGGTRPTTMPGEGPRPTTAPISGSRSAT